MSDSQKVSGLETDRYSKEASRVEAVELSLDNFDKVVDWIELNGGVVRRHSESDSLLVQVHTNEEWMRATIGDWVVYEPYSKDRPFYVCQPIIFTQAYHGSGSA